MVWDIVVNVLLVVLFIVVLALPFVVVLYILVAQALNKPNTEHNVDTKPLEIYKRIKVKAIEPCVIKELLHTIRELKEISIDKINKMTTKR